MKDMEKYDIICESLQEQVDAGALTLENAEMINDLAYEKYVTEGKVFDWIKSKIKRKSSKKSAEPVVRKGYNVGMYHVAWSEELSTEEKEEAEKFIKSLNDSYIKKEVKKYITDAYNYDKENVYDEDDELVPLSKVLSKVEYTISGYYPSSMDLWASCSDWCDQENSNLFPEAECTLTKDGKIKLTTFHVG